MHIFLSQSIPNNFYQQHFVKRLQELKLVFRKTDGRMDGRMDRRSRNSYLDTPFNWKGTVFSDIFQNVFPQKC